MITSQNHFRELVARVKAMIRRGPGQSSKQDVLAAGSISLYLQEHRVVKDGSEILLLPKEFALLEFFLRHAGQVFSAEALIQRVWDSEKDASPETIRSYITRLRSKLGATKENPLIMTVHGVGYKFCADIQ